MDDGICFEESRVADSFNDFFTTIAHKLVKELPSGIGKFTSSFFTIFYKSKGILLDSFKFSSVNQHEVEKFLCGMSRDKATGIDGIPARFLRDGATEISKPITHIINVSISSGKVPSEFKIARVVPLHKKKSKTDAGNYRPVSILSCLSKVFERIIYDQLSEYLKSKNLIYDLQSGFRPGFSTDTTLTYLTDYIRKQMDRGSLTGMVMLDLQKAFDTVDHSILLSKLTAIGLDPTSVSWLESYLSDRSQSVDVGGTRSDPKPISCGVPQGSILGPLLFLIYVNDMQLQLNVNSCYILMTLLFLSLGKMLVRYKKS